MIDALTELIENLWRNRVRTAITSASVAWGIFMLVLLLGFGHGLQNSVEWDFRDDAVNSIWVRRGKTTVPFDGYPVGRRLVYTNRDHDAIESSVPGVRRITSRFYPPTSGQVHWGEEEGSFDLRATHPDHRYLENTIVVAGRFLNDRDLDEKRKVAVVGSEVKRQLFKGADPIGEWLDIGGVMFKVVGVFDDTGGVGEMQQIYLPITTAQSAYHGGDRVHQVMFTVDPATTVAESEKMAAAVRALIGRRHHVSPKDRQAVRVRNNIEQFQQVQTIFKMIRGFVWVVGLGTVMAGIVGVSNIMLVSVKERTQEIGLRKALGATPGSIVRMILTEAIVLTGVSGYVGLVTGVALLEMVRRFAPENDYLREPDVQLSVAVAATLLLVVAGAIAGLVPALQAASVNPIVALRDE